MRRSAILALACLAALAAWTSPAFAAGNGMLAAVASDGRLVTLNPDGSGLRTVWTPTGTITGLAWSPDGNRLALIAGGKLVVWDLSTGTSRSLPTEGYSDPVWSTTGANIGLRRGTSAVVVSADLSQERVEVADLRADQFAWAPNLKEYAYTADGRLYWSGMELEIAASIVDAPAWSPDANSLALVSSASLSVGKPGGLYTRTPIGSSAATTFVAPLPLRSPRWTPDGSKLLYAADGDWKTVPADGGSAVPVPGSAGATLADWQPCTPGKTIACASYAPPVCTVLSQSVTTSAGTPVDLPAPECRDPAGLALSMIVLTGPDHGTLTGQRYTPAPGFVGQDALTYRMSNGSGVSETVAVKIFVVPRPAPSVVLPSPGPVTPRAPFLTARATPKLDRKRTVLVKLACDQNCSFEVRLTGQLKKGKKTVKGSLVKHTLGGTGVLSLRLRLPTKPKGTLKTVWITGTVRNAAGLSRGVKLPVRLPR